MASSRSAKWDPEVKGIHGADGSSAECSPCRCDLRLLYVLGKKLFVLKVWRLRLGPERHKRNGRAGVWAGGQADELLLDAVARLTRAMRPPARKLVVRLSTMLVAGDRRLCVKGLAIFETDVTPRIMLWADSSRGRTSERIVFLGARRLLSVAGLFRIGAGRCVVKMMS